MTTPTSASARIEAARKALAALEVDIDTWSSMFGRGDITQNAATALRALIEPPATGEGAEEIAARVLLDFADREPFVAAKLAGLVRSVKEITLEAVHAGIQAAWNTWEPADMGDGTAPPEENFWDDRTTPLAYGKSDSDRDMAIRRRLILGARASVAYNQKRLGSTESLTGVIALLDLIDPEGASK